MIRWRLEIPTALSFRPISHGFKAVRPKLVMFKGFEEAATAVDEMFTIAFQTAGRTSPDSS